MIGRDTGALSVKDAVMLCSGPNGATYVLDVVGYRSCLKVLISGGVHVARPGAGGRRGGLRVFIAKGGQTPSRFELQGTRVAANAAMRRAVQSHTNRQAPRVSICTEEAVATRSHSLTH